MAPNVALSARVINELVPLQVLSELLTESHDTENDLTILLHWLQPYYLHTNKEYIAPLARTRAAARQCLREPSVQLKFVDLFLNSIASELEMHFGPLVRALPLQIILKQVSRLSLYYHKQVTTLNLTDVAEDLFKRSLKALFVPYLLAPKLKAELMELLSKEDAGDSISSLRSYAAMGMAPFIQSLVVSVTTDKIHLFVVDSCTGVWNKPCLADLEQWIRVRIYPSFVAGYFDTPSLRFSSSNDLVEFSHNELVLLRTTEIYEMVVNYTKSQVALSELHQCLASSSVSMLTLQRARLVDTFVGRCNLNLLHLGSNTVKIIAEYINTIKAFLVVDPTGVLLDKVARPIRKYLKTRRDLVSQLVKGMLDKNPQTNRLHGLADALNNPSSSSVAIVDDLTDINWIPDPIDALPDFKKGKVSDFVDALTSILPLSTVLIEEFTKMFAARLLEGGDDSGELWNYMDNLKSRFGQSEFSTLDVMINDVAQSHSINQAIVATSLTLTILSRNYWPNIGDHGSESDFSVPIQDKFEEYSKAFSELRKGRQLKLLPSMGHVEVELEFDNCHKEFIVTPAQATVIEVFNDDDDEISTETVSLSTGMTNYATTQALDFWVKQNVLEDVGRQKFKAIKTYLK